MEKLSLDPLLNPLCIFIRLDIVVTIDFLSIILSSIPSFRVSTITERHGVRKID